MEENEDRRIGIERMRDLISFNPATADLRAESFSAAVAIAVEDSREEWERVKGVEIIIIENRREGVVVDLEIDTRTKGQCI